MNYERSIWKVKNYVLFILNELTDGDVNKLTNTYEFVVCKEGRAFVDVDSKIRSEMRFSRKTEEKIKLRDLP